MDIKISKHALQRMSERGLTEQQVRHFFETNEGLISIDSSDRDLTAAVVVAIINGKKYRLVYNIIEDVLVTIYPVK